jgi:hypothetical protein
MFAWIVNRHKHPKFFKFNKFDSLVSFKVIKITAVNYEPTSRVDGGGCHWPTIPACLNWWLKPYRTQRVNP